jgi:hypothetical protein
MQTAVPIWTRITLETISGGGARVVFPTGQMEQAPYTLFLWTIFFKIDGESGAKLTLVGSNFKLQGTARVFPTSGDHGDLPNSGAAVVSIPAALGNFRIKVTPIQFNTQPVTSGFVGCVAVLWVQNSTSDDAISAGHQAFNRSFEQQLNALIANVSFPISEVIGGGSPPSPITPAEIKALEQQVKSAVQQTITNVVLADSLPGDVLGGGPAALWQLEGTSQDSPVGTVVYYFSGGALAASPATGISLGNGFPNQVTIQSNEDYGGGGTALIPVTFTFGGVIVTDPFPLSLERILTRLGVTSLKKAMTASSFPFERRDSLASWMNAYESHAL